MGNQIRGRPFVLLPVLRLPVDVLAEDGKVGETVSELPQSPQNDASTVLSAPHAEQYFISRLDY